jgi:hypothetical protein
VTRLEFATTDSGDGRLSFGSPTILEVSLGPRIAMLSRGHSISFYCENPLDIIKHDKRNVCSTERRRLWHPLAEQDESPKTRSRCH